MEINGVEMKEILGRGMKPALEWTQDDRPVPVGVHSITSPEELPTPEAVSPINSPVILSSISPKVNLDDPITASAVVVRVESAASLPTPSSTASPDTSLPPSDSILALPASPTVLANSSSSATIAPMPALTPTAAPTLRVLVVDDDKITRLLMSRMVTRLGHKVTTAEDGLAALNTLLGLDPTCTTLLPSSVSYSGSFSPHPSSDSLLNGEIVSGLKLDGEGIPVTEFDLMFLDNSMPVLTGVECIRRVRDLGVEVFACGVTGNAMKEDQEEFFEAGIDRILTKPVQERNVREVIEGVLEAKRKAAEAAAKAGGA
ncbi:hypothetical protein HK097_002961 [Rhizophlyctis rosea]|uniref:Response regulatory domain-containing protein n=1 Tax=Rhizophlyctis rosea TaxID=64517 RepID=A0AAD5WY49_9FUNG|nr:hypothetical protein HK097_002961 [Rhizophlyctis rosea]